MDKILIYSDRITERIRYVFDFIWQDFSGLQTEYTDDRQSFEASGLPAVSYSDQPFENRINFVTDEFMFETGISNLPDFQKLNPIGRIFYALSRYEEYTDTARDRHNRLPGEGRVYSTPFADELVIGFQNELRKMYPQIEFRKREFSLLMTSDVDQAWKYRHKGFVRSCGGMLTELFGADFKSLSERISVIRGRQKDPFDSFDYFRMLKRKYSFEMIFFWLMADYSKFDKNNPVGNNAFRRKIREVSEWSDFGIHPSYESSVHPVKIEIEKARLSTILGKPVTKSRQHYIRLNFPDTYRNLIKYGITDDYTMAYADVTGFRAGSTSPFRWYDLEKEETTALVVHPFCAMDVSMRNYMKLSAADSVRELGRLKSEIKKTNGRMVLLFHNSNLSDEWEGWNEVLESVFD